MSSSEGCAWSEAGRIGWLTDDVVLRAERSQLDPVPVDPEALNHNVLDVHRRSVYGVALQHARPGGEGAERCAHQRCGGAKGLRERRATAAAGAHRGFTRSFARFADGWRFIQDSSVRHVPERARQAILSMIRLAAGGDQPGGGLRKDEPHSQKSMMHPKELCGEGDFF